MRLIDADNLKAELKKLPMMSNWGETFMPSLIDDQPTAYDPDRVVEQLEEVSATYCKEYGYAKDENVLYLSDAIEIVKKGGTREVMPEYEMLKERDRAKKPDLEGDGYDPDGNLVYDIWICPNCEERYEVDYQHYDFCPKCGQRLDWGEDLTN